MFPRPDSVTTKKAFEFISSATENAEVSVFPLEIIDYQFQFILSGIIYTAIQLRFYAAVKDFGFGNEILFEHRQ